MASAASCPHGVLAAGVLLSKKPSVWTFLSFSCPYLYHWQCCQMLPLSEGNLVSQWAAVAVLRPSCDVSTQLSPLDQSRLNKRVRKSSCRGAHLLISRRAGNAGKGRSHETVLSTISLSKADHTLEGRSHEAGPLCESSPSMPPHSS